MGRWVSAALFHSPSRFAPAEKRTGRRKPPVLRRRFVAEQLEDRTVPSVVVGTPNPNETVNTSLTPAQLAQMLVGPGVTVSNATFTGGAASTGSFSFTNPAVVGFGQGIVLSSGSAADVVGPNLSDWTSTDFCLPGDPALDALSGFTTHDAAVLDFDFVPTANQVVFQYAFASDEYPEWVNTQYNDVFGFFINGTNYATVRQVAGDPNSPFVPVAVNNVNNGNPLDPAFAPARPDLFRANYFNPNGPSALDLELDGITSVLTFQAPVTPGAVNHMKLAIADASDGIYDSAVFIQAGSLVSNENPVADLSVAPVSGPAPLSVTATVEGKDPNGQPLTYGIDWGDGTAPSTGGLPNETTLVDHTYATAGQFVVTLTVSNGTLVGTSTEDVYVSGAAAQPVVTLQPKDQNVVAGDGFTFQAAAAGVPAPTVQWQVSTDGGQTFEGIPGATSPTYGGTASLQDSGNLYRAVFTNENGSATTDTAMLAVAAQQTTITVTGGTFTYDGTAHAATATATDANGEPLEGTFTFTYNGSAIPPTSAGSYAVVATFTSEDSASQTTGYGSIFIKPASPSLTVVGGSFPYDGKAHVAAATALSVDGVNQVAGHFSFTYNGSASAPVDAGTYLVTATFTSGDTNYANATEAGTIVIVKANPHVSVSDVTFTYNGAGHAVAASATGVNGEPLGPVVVTYAGTSDLPVNAGTYAVAAFFGGDNNYTAASANATLVINRAAPVLTITGGTYTYDGNPHPAAVTLTGVNGAALGPVTVTYNGGAALPVNPGTYAVAAAFAGDSNYLPVSNAGSGQAVVITAGALTVQSVAVNDGTSPQRSMVSSLTVTFSQAITSLDPGAFEIDTGATRLFPTDLSVSGNQVVIRFTGLAGVVGGSLADGRYTLITHQGKIHGGTYQTLADHSDAFFRLFGDVNGDGKVDNTDLAAFLLAYRSRRGMTNYRWYFDYGGDGMIDATDYYQILRRSGSHV